MTNAKPKSNLAKMWGNVLSKDYEKKESKKNNEYRISLYGKISESNRCKKSSKIKNKQISSE